MPEIETQNGTVEVEEGDTVNIAFKKNKPEKFEECEGAEVETIQGAAFMGYSLVLDNGFIAHDENIESLEVL